ncbi:MAG: hypothetical protein ABSD72_01305 [Terracidiphilus sp.]|jgi:hypothetical protein
MNPLKVNTLLLLWLALPAMASNHAPPPAPPAGSFAAVEVHEDEKVAIAAEPYDTREKEAIFHADYLSGGVMPIRVIITNNSDRPISLLEARITFITAEHTTIQVGEPAGVATVMTRKVAEGGQDPPPDTKSMPKVGRREIDADFDTFQFRAMVVAPHSTLAGFVFFNVSGHDHPLEGAKLQIRALRDASGAQLFDFEIPFDKYLKAQSSPESKPSPAK